MAQHLVPSSAPSSRQHKNTALKLADSKLANPLAIERDLPFRPQSRAGSSTAATNLGNLTGTTEYRSRGSGDRRLQFTLSRSNRLRFALDGTAGQSMQVFKADGTPIKSVIPANGKVLSTRLRSGDYEVQINSPSDPTARYSLNIKGSGSASDAGDAWSEALDLGNLSGSRRMLQQRVGGRSDRQDYYQINLANSGRLDLSLTGLRRDADLVLFDANGDEVDRSANGDRTSEFLRQNLNAGTYYVQVSPESSRRLQYTLTLDGSVSSSTVPNPPSSPAVPTPPSTATGNSLGDAIATPATFTQRGQVNATKNSTFYRFNVNQSGVFTADLTGLTGDADVRLVQDANNNGRIDQGEVLAWQWERGTESESIRKFVGAGNYFVQVVGYNNQTADYTVNSNFTAAASDDRKFSIRLNYGEGLTNISNTVRSAIAQAAKVWENAISHSSFNGTHTLDIDVLGVSTPDSWYAAATNKLGINDKSGKWMPTTGRVRINTNYANTYNSNPDYLSAILTHEFAHVLGIGTLWEDNGRSLVDYTTGKYVSDSYAGLAYGELTGNLSAGIPLSKDRDSNGQIVYGHWDESTFGGELLTPQTEGAGLNMPLSQMTIASLRDIGWNVNYGAADSFALSRAKTSTISYGPSDLSNGLYVRCGCATHMAQSNGLNLVGSTSLSDMIRG